MIAVASCSLFAALPACRTRRRTASRDDFWPPPSAPRDAGPPAEARGPAAELEPGTIRAFGLLLPAGSTEHITTDNERVYYVNAPVPALMRYLQRRLVILSGEIHPLGALIRNAQVRAAPEGESWTLDVGVRAEGERTMLTLWNRTALPLPPRSLDEGLRAAGIDPRTGQPLPENNR